MKLKEKTKGPKERKKEKRKKNLSRRIGSKWKDIQ
jgi:hypothetical protein